MNDTNGLFELMTKMYSDMQTGFSSVNERLDKVECRLGNVENRLDKVEGRLDTVEIGIAKTNVIIENEIMPKIEALFDGYKQNTEAITRIEDDVKELRISVNNLNIKTIQNENNIISFTKRLVQFENNNH